MRKQYRPGNGNDGYRGAHVGGTPFRYSDQPPVASGFKGFSFPLPTPAPRRSARRISRRQKRYFAVLCLVMVAMQLVGFEDLTEAFPVSEQSMPNYRVLKRMFMSRIFGKRKLSQPLPGGGCEWLAPEKLNATYDPPRTLLVSYPGSGKRLTWRTIESMTGLVAGDDWDLSEEGMNVATMKTSYPHPEGVWTWGDRFKSSSIIMLIRNPRWAIPSYQTMRHELDYSGSWTQSYFRRPNTYTERPDIIEWEQWRGNTWPHGNQGGMFAREIDRWGWFIDFWMNDGLRRNDGYGNPIQDWHCRNTTYQMDTCKPKVLIAFEKLYGPEGQYEAQKLMYALEDNRTDFPAVTSEARECVFEKMVGKRAEEIQWDNSARDGSGPDNMQKNFTWLQLQYTKDELERLIMKYINETDPVAEDLVSNLQVYLEEVETEIDITYPYTWWPTPSPSAFPSKMPTSLPSISPSSNPTQNPTFHPTPYPTFSPTPNPTNSPTLNPTPYPTFSPTPNPTNSPTPNPTAFPTLHPTPNPTHSPSFDPTYYPTFKPTAFPTPQPTKSPTDLPTYPPTKSPTDLPTYPPTKSPTDLPTYPPTKSPTDLQTP